eukprot:941861-Amphidinium_carterae.1
MPCQGLIAYLSAAFKSLYLLALKAMLELLALTTLHVHTVLWLSPGNDFRKQIYAMKCKRWSPIESP